MTLARWDAHFQMPEGVPRSAPPFQLPRRVVLAKARNRLLSAALRDEEWVLWLDIDVGDIASAEDREEGGFLGIGKADILELTFSGKASISRARFHLKGQESSDWQAEIRQVQTGVTDNERGEAFDQSIEYTFPSQCPSCMATLPVPHRGADRVTCEYCGTVTVAERI